MNKRKLDWIKFTSLILIIAVILILIQVFEVGRFLSPSLLRETIIGHGAVAPIVFIIIYILTTVFFLPGTPLTISSGLIFGSFLGTIYTVVGATIGATLAFIISRYLGKSFVERLLKNRYRKLYLYDKKIEENGLLVVLFLRLVPLFPFNGLNFALGLTKLEKKDFIIGTAFGIIPGSFVLAFFGNSLTELNIMKMVIAGLLFVLLALTPVLYKKLKKR